MAKVAQRLSVIKMSDEERAEYFKYLKEVVHSQDVLAASRAEGKAEGEAIGLEKGKLEATINLLREKVDDGVICRTMGLSADKLADLKKEHKL
jgi:hypothetical protein